MAPKSFTTNEEFILIMLSCSEPVKTDWAKVAEKRGYSRAGDT